MTTSDQAFRFHGILIAGRSIIRRYADVLAVIARSASAIYSHKYTQEMLNACIKEDALTFADIGDGSAKIGRSVSYNGKITFGFFSHDKMVDPELSDIRTISNDIWITLEEYTENHARQIARNERFQIKPNDKLIRAWKAWENQNVVPNYYKVEDLKLTNKRKAVSTPYELVQWYENVLHSDNLRIALLDDFTKQIEHGLETTAEGTITIKIPDWVKPEQMGTAKEVFNELRKDSAKIELEEQSKDNIDVAGDD